MHRPFLLGGAHVRRFLGAFYVAPLEVTGWSARWLLLPTIRLVYFALTHSTLLDHLLPLGFHLCHSLQDVFGGALNNLWFDILHLNNFSFFADWLIDSQFASSQAAQEPLKRIGCDLVICPNLLEILSDFKFFFLQFGQYALL